MHLMMVYLSDTLPNEKKIKHFYDTFRTLMQHNLNISKIEFRVYSTV